MLQVFILTPGEQQSVALCTGDPLLWAFVIGSWQSCDLLVYFTRWWIPREQSGLVELDPPQLWNALIGCSATLTNLSQQMNGYSQLQSNSREQEGTDKTRHLCPDGMGDRADKVRRSRFQMGGWSQCKRGWLRQLIPLLIKYLWCVLTRRKAPINFYNILFVDLLLSGSEIKI